MIPVVGTVNPDGTVTFLDCTRDVRVPLIRPIIGRIDSAADAAFDLAATVDDMTCEVDYFQLGRLLAARDLLRAAGVELYAAACELNGDAG